MSEARDIERLFEGADAVDVRPIEMIHRGHDGGVAFARKIDGKFEQLWSLPAKGIAGVFADVVAEIERDGFFSINGFRSSLDKSKANPKLPRAVRQSGLVRWITAAFVDLDLYRFEGWTFGSTVGRILDLQDAGSIPTATMIVRSGQGVWLLWLLAETQGGRKPVKAWPEKIECWGRIQGELARLVAHHLLPPDANARDVARVMRVPGSINTKAAIGTRVKFVPFLDASGEPIVYGLDELASLIGVRPSRQKRRPSDKPPDPAKREAGLKGKRELARKRLAWILRLGELRGGFAEGMRQHAAIMFAKFALESCHESDGSRIDANGEPLDIRRSVGRFIDTHCARGTHPVTARDVLAGDRFAKLRWSDVRILETLEVTDDEARAVGCPTLGEARERQERRDKDPNRDERARSRRELVVHFVQRIMQGGSPPPTLETVQHHLAAVGIETTKPTIGRDWDQLTLAGRLPPRPTKPGKLTRAPLARLLP